MTKELNIYSMPNEGCMLGAAYQTQVAGLQTSLDRAGLNLSVPEYMILRTLYCHDGIQQCEIAELLGKDKAAVCRTIKKMIEKKLLRSEPLSHKCLRIFVDSLGRQLQPEIMAVAEARQHELAALLSPAERETFVTVLKKIINKQ